MHVVFLGPPGAGKGTQARMIAEGRGIPHISTGDIFRAAVKEGTPLGREAQGYMDRGELVPDQVVLGLVRERLARPDCGPGFILDGFPRTVPQADALDQNLRELDLPLDCAIDFRVERADLVRRLSSRVTCKQCGAVFNLLTNPPRKAGRCDVCGGETHVRVDDQKETVERRLVEYDKKTAPLVAWYEARGKLCPVDASGSPEDVRARVSGILSST